MFLDHHEHTLDGKGRIILPSAFRHAFHDGLVFAPGQDNVIEVWPRADFDARLQELRNRPQSNEAQRKFVRSYVHNASPAQLDNQGRVVVPPRMRAYAELDREVVVAGNITHIEIWDAERFRAYQEDSLADLAVLDEPLG